MGIIIHDGLTATFGADCFNTYSIYVPPVIAMFDKMTKWYRFIVSRRRLPPSSFALLNKITMNDGYKYSVTKRYSQFEQLRESVARLLRAVTPPFPPKHGMRSATVGLGQPELEERRCVSGHGEEGTEGSVRIC